MTRRRRSDAALPRLPLEFAFPLEVRRRGMEDAAVLDELPGESALIVLKTLRLVYAWSSGPNLAGALLRCKELESFEREVAAAALEEGLWEPLITIVAELKQPAQAKTGSLGLSCFVLSEWALGAGAEGTALLFAEAAALAWPEHARYAWMVGRMLRNHGHFREAELWLRRAARVAVWWGDCETQALALNSLGNLCAQQGALGDALRYLTRALALAKRHKMKDRVGAITHDLFMVSVFRGEHTKAEQLAVSAFGLYGPQHPNLPKLAHDVAYFWNQQGRFAAALPVLRALLPLLRLPEERLRVVAATIRAAGACSERSIFEDAWAEVWEIISRETPVLRPVLPSALVDVGLGAANFGEWSRATEALTRALDTARQVGMHETVTQAEVTLEMVRRHEAWSRCEQSAREEQPHVYRAHSFSLWGRHPHLMESIAAGRREVVLPHPPSLFTRSSAGAEHIAAT